MCACVKHARKQKKEPIRRIVMNDFRTLCQHRRSIRTFTTQSVEREKIDYILQCALMSPSAKRLNPWEFVVVTDEAVLRQLAGCKTYGSQMFKTATAGIVVALDSSLTDTWQADGAIAAEHMLLAAEEQGLGACWCHVYGRDESEAMVRRLTNLPDKYNVLCVIALGYKAEERKDYDLDKLLYNKIHIDRFAQR